MSHTEYNSEHWDTIIKPGKKWFDFKLKEIWMHRDLIYLFIRRDFVAYYKQTILGPLWFFIQPIFTTLIFLLVFGKIAQIPTAGIPSALFYLSGIINWNYFADGVNKTSNTFITNANIFGKVYFPRLVTPISIVLSNLITYFIQFSLFIAVLLYFIISHRITLHIDFKLFILPLLILQMILFGLGVGIVVSSMTTKYKDLSFAITFGIQLWLYATPVVYSMTRIPHKWRWILYVNPMAPVVETFRSIIFNTYPIVWPLYISGWAITIVILFTGISMFNRIEKSFMDTV
jgi:lipopolysaccharide transport system permease protein